MSFLQLEKAVENSLLQRFIKYVQIDTRSNDKSESTPSSAGQQLFAQLLLQELKLLGVHKAYLSPQGYIYAHVPANVSHAPKVGFIAHLDTSPDLPGKANPQVIYDYQGQAIALDENHFLDPSQFPELLTYVGHTLVCTDGKSLLGADDKAGIAEIMTMLEFLNLHPQTPHGDVYIAFTPDEEIGRGTKFFDTSLFPVDFAYTVDGGPVGEIEAENFNAAKATISIQGTTFHPGYAKGKMLNAIHLLMEFLAMLPPHERPEYTDGKDGFFHCYLMEGSVKLAKAELLIRDFDKGAFERKKDFLRQLSSFLQGKYPSSHISIDIEDQYVNMREVVDKHPHVLDVALKAIQQAGISPKLTAIRGGTDGAQLSSMGIPCPNLFTGGHNFHSIYEYISLQSMIKAVITLLNIVTLTTTSTYEK